MSEIKQIFETLRSNCYEAQMWAKSQHPPPPEYYKIYFDTYKKLVSIGLPAMEEIVSELHNTPSRAHQHRAERAYRIRLLEALADIGGEQSVRHLCYEHKHSSNMGEKSHILYTLAEIGGEQSFRHLCYTYKHTPDKYEGYVIIYCLIHIDDPRMLDILVHALINASNYDKEEDNYLKPLIALVKTLGNHRYIGAIDPLVNELKSVESYNPFHRVIISTLTRFSDPRIIKPLTSVLKKDPRDFKEYHSDIFAALSNIGVPSVEPLIELINHSDWNIRELVNITLSKIGKTSAEALLPKLTDNDPKIRRAAAGSLGTVGHYVSTDSLVVSVKNDKDAGVRKAAAWALGNIGGQSAVKALIDIMQSDDDRDVRESAARTLGNAREQSAIEAIITSINQSRISRKVGMKVLMQIGETNISAFSDTLRDKDLRKVLIGLKVISSNKSEESVEYLIMALQDRREQVRAQSAEILGDFSYKLANKAIKTLVKLSWGDKNEQVRNTVSRTLLMLKRQISFSEFPWGWFFTRIKRPF